MSEHQAPQSSGVTARLLAGFLALDPAIWRLALARSINTMGFSLVMPFLALYLVRDRGASGATFGLVYLLSGICSAVGQAVAGELTDRVGRRKVMVGGLLFRMLTMAALGFAVLAEGPVLLVGGLVVLAGFLRAIFEPPASAAVTELAPPQARVAAFGLQRMGVNLGWAVGPALGGLLAAQSYGALFFVAAPATLLAILAVLPIPDGGGSAARSAEPFTPRAIAAALRENRPFALYLGLVLVASILTVQIFSTLSVYASTELGLTEADVGLLYTVNGVLVVLFQVPAVQLVGLFGMRRTLVLGAALYAAAYLLFGAAAGFVGLALGMAVLTLGEVIFAPALSDLAATLGDPKRMGRAFGLFGLTQSLGLSLGPLLGGVAYDGLRGDPLTLWGIFAVGMAAVAAAYALLGSRLRLAQ
ncbi:MFS transporter [Vulgatibacter sp.]|uniref:MFS transporter n=1 Tax=Vulgatibacter sp. TaxID=1971226 RepID=UPI0035672A1C